MNDYQEEKHASNKLVVKIARENPTIISLIPDFEAGIKRQEEINAEIEKIRPLQEKDNSGVAENKQFTVKNLLNQTLDISGAVHSCANKKNDVLLMGKMNYKSSTLSKQTPGKLIAVATTVLDEAKKLPAEELSRAGITVAELTAYEEIVTYFKGISNSPREAQIETSVYTKLLKKLFKESSNLYKNSLDRLANQFKSKAPEFYLRYRSARKSIHRGGDGPDEK